VIAEDKTLWVFANLELAALFESHFAENVFDTFAGNELKRDTNHARRGGHSRDLTNAAELLMKIGLDKIGEEKIGEAPREISPVATRGCCEFIGCNNSRKSLFKVK